MNKTHFKTGFYEVLAVLGETYEQQITPLYSKYKRELKLKHIGVKSVTFCSKQKADNIKVGDEVRVDL